MSSRGLSAEQRSALATDRHLAVVANAGSGKTTVLTWRYLWLLVEHHVPIDRIVCITFTTKAAAEMRKRVGQLITSMIASPEQRSAMGFSRDDADVLKRLDELRRELGDARISTFHSFCSGLIRQFGHVRGIDPESIALSERDVAAMRDRSVRLAIRSYLDDHRADLLEVYEQLDFTAFEAAVASLSRSVERFHLLERRHGTDHSIDEQTHLARLEAFRVVAASMLPWVDHCLAQAATYGAAGNPLTTAFLDHGAELRSRLQQPTDVDATVFADVEEYLLRIYTKTGEPRKTDKKAFPGSMHSDPIGKSALDLVKGLVEGADEARDLVQTRVAWHAARVARLAHDHYSREKRARNAIDFDDMMSGVVDLLDQHPAIAAYVTSTMDHLMVDEYQDTNPTQYRLMQLLVPQLVDPGAAEGPMVFVVGDDKQGIYGFRDADVRLFRQTVQDLERLNAARGSSTEPTLLTLATSYRMAKPLAETINQLCGEIFSGTSEFDVPYEDLLSGRAEEPTGAIGSLRTLITDLVADDDAPDELGMTGAEREARHVVRMVVQMLQRAELLVQDTVTRALRPVEPGDIALLARRTSTVTALAAELQHRQVPYHVYGGRAFFSRPEVADLRNLLTAAIDPDQPLALAALLRSPIGRCTDNDLTQIAYANPQEGFGWEGLQALASRGTASAAALRAIDLVQSLRGRLRTDAAHVALRDALEASGYFATLRGQIRCDQMLANIDKALDLVRQASMVPGATLRDVVDALSVPEDGDREAEGTVLRDPSSVQVMTIHAAKGLEFPVVVVCDVSSQTNNRHAYTLTDRIGLSLSLGGAVQRLDAEKPETLPKGLIATANAMLLEQREQAEARRLLYVAFTRAKDHAVISMTRRFNKMDPDTGEIPVASGRGSMGKLLHPLLVDPPQLPVLDPVPDVPPYSSAATERSVLDLSQPLGLVFAPASISVTDLLPSIEAPTAGAAEQAEALALGTVVHDTLEALLRENAPSSHDAIHTLVHGHPLVVPSIIDAAIHHMQAVVQSAVWPVVLGAQPERTIGAMLSDTLLYGRVDALRVHGTEAEVWDWKTNAVQPETLAATAEHYAIQMEAYAWILLTAYGAERVTTRLVFTAQLPAMGQGALVEHAYTRADVDHLAARLGERLSAQR